MSCVLQCNVVHVCFKEQNLLYIVKISTEVAAELPSIFVLTYT